MSKATKTLTSTNFGIFVLIVCCLYFVFMQNIPGTLCFLIRILLLTLLCINLLFCVISRCRILAHSMTARKVGSLFLHLGIIVIISAGFCGGLRQNAAIKILENETVDLTPKGFPVAIRAEEIKSEHYPGGEIKQFFTTISFLEKDRVVQTKTISVNHPASYKGIKVYQSTFESTPNGNVSGLTVKKEPYLHFVWVGFAFLSAGSFLNFLGVKQDIAFRK